MELRYTNSPKSETEQTNPSASLGGFISSSKLPNDVFDNLFSEITQLVIQNKSRETFLIALKNTTGGLAENVKIKFGLDSNLITKLSVAVVSPAVDSCGDDIYEKISNSSALPTTGSFIEVSDGSELSLGMIADKKSLGIWFSRSIDETKIVPKTCEKLDEDFVNNVVDPQQENIKITISFESEQSISVSQSVSVSVSTSISNS